MNIKRLNVFACSVIAFACFCLTMAVISGCGTPTVGNTAGKIEGVAIPTVNGAMYAWRDWVKAGHATQHQVDTVKNIYNQYYAAQLVASNAVDAWFLINSSTNATPSTIANASNAVVSATANVGATQSNLISTISTLTHP